jgi:hypothetical protein
MVSLLKLAKITEEGVRFLSPHDGAPMHVWFYICEFLIQDMNDSLLGSLHPNIQYHCKIL